jgi:hypothetical protein
MIAKRAYYDAHNRLVLDGALTCAGRPIRALDNGQGHYIWSSAHPWSRSIYGPGGGAVKFTAHHLAVVDR